MAESPVGEHPDAEPEGGPQNCVKDPRQASVRENRISVGEPARTHDRVHMFVPAESLELCFEDLPLLDESGDLGRRSALPGACRIACTHTRHALVVLDVERVAVVRRLCGAGRIPCRIGIAPGIRFVVARIPRKPADGVAHESLLFWRCEVSA